MSDTRMAFRDLVIELAERRVTLGGRALTLAPKAHDVLVYLARHAGSLVTKQALLDALWPDAFVEEGILAVHVSALRRALGDATFIETVPKAGYRFVGERTIANGARYADAHSKVRPDASIYELVGHARRLLMAVKPNVLAEAVTRLEQAIEIDAAYAPAHACLALAQCARAEWRQAPAADAFASAKSEALRAIAIDVESADAHVALGAVLFFSEWDWMAAERSLQRALALNPRHTQARLLYGRVLDAQDRRDEGLSVKLLALEDEPFSPSVHLAIAQSYWNQRRYDDTVRWAQKTLELDDKHLLAREFLAGVHWAHGDFDRHMEENLRHAAAYGLTAEALEPLRQKYAADGRAGVLRMSLDQAAANPSPVADIQAALAHAELGNGDDAVAALERAIGRRDPCLVDLAVAPQWDSLRKHPRFTACLKQMKLPVVPAAP